MDNEEIRKLLQELKESSDESSAVRSKIVKIHMDTPAEAERRRKAKEREQAKEAKRLAEEQAKARAEEEARRAEAEKAALEVVEEAKREAKAGFASDLEEDILSGDLIRPETEESGESAEDLDLSWEYEKPTLTSGFARDEDFDLGGGSGRGTNHRKQDPDDEFDMDEADFRTEDGDAQDGEERESITGLPGMFGALSDRVLSFFGGIRRSVKEDLSKNRSHPEAEEPDAGTDDAPDESMKAAPEEAGTDTGNVPEKLWADTDGTSKKPWADMDDMPEGTGTDAGDAQRGLWADTDDVPESAPREYGPDEEWKRRLEEPPKKRSRFRSLQLKMGALSRADRPKKEKKQRRPGSRKSKKNREREPGVEDTGNPERTLSGSGDTLPAPGTTAAQETTVSEPKPAREPEAGATREAGSDMDMSPEQQAVRDPEDGASREAGYEITMSPEQYAGHDAGSGMFREAEAASGIEPASDKEPAQKSIEVIDLNENQNNKEAKVIPLDGSTGPLPDPAELKKAAAKRNASGIKGMLGALPRRKARAKKRSSADDGKERTKKQRSAEKKEKERRTPKAAAPGAFFSAHKKQCIIAAVITAAAIIAGIFIFFAVSKFRSARRALIEADEGMTVSILEQPDAYTDEGDVRIRVKTPETIQSITVNGENVVVSQGRTVEFTYHATGGTLDIMAVCTDKVRSAKVVLAYVDAQPPSVTIREKDGKIELSAEDTESGLKALYIGTTNGVSEVPLYEEYSGPLEVDPDKEITYYAEDAAGNSTVPVTVALTPAESITFNQERYGLFPGQTEPVSLVTTPANAFVNNLVLEAENPKVVQIEGGVMLRGMAEGDTKITATADGISGVEASVSVSSQRKVKISAVGDCTLGTDVNFSQNTSFDAFQALYGNSYFFEKVKGILSTDDSTFANFEGTLTTSDQRESKQFAFKGDPSYTQILLDGSIDVVSLANNHSKDYGTQSMTDTENALEDAGIEWCEGDHIAYRDLNGVLTAYIGIYALENGLEKLPQVKSTVAEAKEKGADLIIVEFHWGAELVAEVDPYQKELAHTAVDEGADLVLGSHAHLLQGIEKYNGAYIVYGLGNFCFGGSANPTSYDTMIWQQTFTFTADGLESEDDIAIIPCHVSGDLSSNNYQPVPVSGEDAAKIMQTIDSLSAEFGQSYSQYMVDGTLWTDTGA